MGPHALAEQPGAHRLAVGEAGRGIDEQVGGFAERPFARDPPAQPEVFVQAEQAFENAVDDSAAGGVGVQDRVEQLGVADRGLDEFAQPLRIAAGLRFVVGHPEIGLQQNQGDQCRRQQQEAADHHAPNLPRQRRGRGRAGQEDNRYGRIGWASDGR